MNIDYTQDSLTLMNTCPECIAQEQLCTDCVDTADARLTDKAYELVDEGNLQYKHQWLLNTEPSAHDWVSPVVYLPRPAVQIDGSIVEFRYEYKKPTTDLQDGGELDNLWELQDYTQSQRETECPWCHLLTPKVFNDCQDCDKPLEHNVSTSLYNEISKFIQ
jgi:hypothetical protein